MEYDVLTEPLITMRSDGKSRTHTLPSVLATLACGEVFGDFPALQPHQTHPWYAFLVQIAAIALHRANRVEPPTDTAEWVVLLDALTDGDRAPWCLVSDPRSPALLQAAAPDLPSFKSRLTHPDELDILITTKNHDLKTLRIGAPRPEHWLFALVTLQTMQGYPGRGYYGIARMNGGSGNRPAVGHLPSLGWGPRFLRDVPALLTARYHIAADYDYAEAGGHTLLWLAPWDRKTSLPLTTLDPLFVEICQAVRLVEVDGVIEARKTTQGAARVDAKAQNGRTGDPWTPIDLEGEKSLTLSGAGFDYSKIVDLLMGSYRQGALGERLDNDPCALWFSGWAMVRGQGKTEGMHERQIMVPGEIQSFFEEPEQREVLAKAAQRRVELAREVRGKLLAPSLGRLRGDGGDSKSQVIAEYVGKCLTRFDNEVDVCFFKAMWEDASADVHDETSWRGRLLDIAHDILTDAFDHAPLPSARRYRAIANAEGRFNGGARKFSPEWYKTEAANA